MRAEASAHRAAGRPASAPARVADASSSGRSTADANRQAVDGAQLVVDHYSARLHDAMFCGRSRQFRMLVNVGAVDLDAVSDERGLTPIMLCAYMRSGGDGAGSRAADDRLALYMRRQLLRRGACPSKADARGRTALHHDVLQRRLELAELLLSMSSADQCALMLCKQDRDGVTALHLAVAAGDLALVGLLVDEMSRNRTVVTKKSVDARDRRGLTPLLLACRAGDLRTARRLASPPLRASSRLVDPATGMDGRGWLSRTLLIPSSLDPFVCSEPELSVLRPRWPPPQTASCGGGTVGSAVRALRPATVAFGDRPTETDASPLHAAPAAEQRRLSDAGGPAQEAACVPTCRQSLMALYRMLESQYGILPPARPPRPKDDVDSEAAAAVEAAAAAAAAAAEAERKASGKRAMLRRRSSALLLSPTQPKVVSDKWNVGPTAATGAAVDGPDDASDGSKRRLSSGDAHSADVAARGRRRSSAAVLQAQRPNALEEER